MVSNASCLIIDCLAASKDRRYYTRDLIGSGPRWIAGVIEQNIDCSIQRAEEFLKNPDFSHKLYMISAMSIDSPIVKKIRSKIKNNQKIILGGPITSDPYLCLNKLKADFCVIAEGEIAIRSLLDSDFDPQGISNIAYKDGANIKIGELKRLSKQEYNQFSPSTKRICDYKNYEFARVLVEVLRGCSNFNRAKNDKFNGVCDSCQNCSSSDLKERLTCPGDINPGCGFCSVPSTFGYVKSRSLDNIISEVRELVDLGVQKIVLSAPDFLDYAREELIDDEILTTPCIPQPNYDSIEALLAKTADFDVYFTIENAKACLLDEKVASIISQYLSDSTLHIGCDTGDVEHAKKIGRPCGPHEVKNAIKIAKKYHLKSNVYFIHGLPHQDQKTTQATVDFIKENAKYVEKYTVYRFMPLAMSAFANEKRGKSAHLDANSKAIFDAIKQVNTQKKSDLVGTRVIANLAERHFYNKNDFIAYPIAEGPLILVRRARKYFRRKIEVEITNPISDRLVEGKVIRCLN